MTIKTLVLGALKTNVYILTKGKKALLVDPASDVEAIMKEIEDYNLVGIVVTHYHFDHIGALEDLKNATLATVYDISNLKEGKNSIDDFEFECVYTPGHKSDLIGLYFEEENVYFGGDFIFRDSIGRWDLETGSIIDMKKSIEKILKFSSSMTIYPGHGLSTTLERETTNLKTILKTF